jgi:DNA-binding NarL/FixJ family response regulator
MQAVQPVVLGKPLYPRESEAVALVGHGLNNREIALHMKISRGTVKEYLSRAYAKLGIHSRTEAALWWHQQA